MRFLTPDEQRLLDAARPPERTIIRDLYELLDARLIDGAELGPRRATVGETSGPLHGPVPSGPEVGAAPYDHVYAWGNNERRAELKGRRCRILAHGAKNTILVEFENGEKVTTSRYAARLVSEGVAGESSSEPSANPPDAGALSETSLSLFDREAA